jgi:endogenous inhibitor of DNA gyrase (YacG/DUF329 family)
MQIPNTNDFVLKIPSRCPHCGKYVQFNIVSSYKYDNEVAITLRCPYCSKISFTNGNKFESRNQYGGSNFTCDCKPLYPPMKFKNEFPIKIQELSPKFVTIYEQAMQAKLDGYNEICGMGFRKAAEQLVYDYLLNFQKENEAKLNKNRFIDNLRLLDNEHAKISANVVRIAGNSEVHLLKDMNFNIDDMIKCINILVQFLNLNLEVKEYSDKTPENKKLA